jgi:hypothetical protein
MTNILTWYAPSNNGAFQKTAELGIFSDMLTVKPAFSFAFTSMNYIEQNGTFDIDGVPMTEAQKAEVLAQIEAVVVPVEWKKNVRKQEPMGYLSSTDWYYARKMETGQEVPADVVEKRLAARELIRSIEAE